MDKLTEEQLDGIGVFNMPERSEWKCYLFGNTPDDTGMIWVPNKGCEPNWFWRKMQYLILGNRWVKEKE